MKMVLRLFILSSMSLMTFGRAYASDICLSCELNGLPKSSSFVEMEKLAKNDKFTKGALKARSIAQESDPELKQIYMQKYCREFEQIESTKMDRTLKELETTPYKVEDYFEHSTCQTRGYSDSVKSPMVHYVADDPQKHEDKLDSILFYYSKKKKPEMFTKIINTTNTIGETLLDYIESEKTRGGFGEESLNGPVKRIIAILCEHGGVYKTTKNKECPK